MRWLAILFLGLTVVSGLVSFGLVGSAPYVAAKVPFLVFLILAVLSFLGGYRTGSRDVV
jgi:uncharacterized membrane protein YtjA (UPF0391 family)